MALKLKFNWKAVIIILLVSILSMEYSPVVTNQMLTTYWQDFKYKVWIEKRSKRVFKAEVFADHKDASHNGLHMQLVLYDFNKKINIEAPSTQ